MEKVGRNDPCPCGSGKKFKKCCEAKLSHKGMSARKIEDQTKVKGLSHLFKSRFPTEQKALPTDSEPPSDKS